MEFAICLPIVVTIVFGTIEACEMLYLKRAVTQAAYEGARTAIVPDTSAAQAKLAVQQVLDDRNISGATINVSPNATSSVTAGAYIAVDVTAPVSGNVFCAIITADAEVDAHVEMMKEF